MNTMNTCSFTGHRPKAFVFGYDETHEKCVGLKQEIENQIRQLIAQGVTTFYTGMAMGTDIWCAEIVMALKSEIPQLHLIAVIPCATQSDKWSQAWKERYRRIVSSCDNVVFISKEYTRTCMHLRNDYLVDHADVLLAVYDSGAKGGTAYTVKKASSIQLKTIVIDAVRFGALAENTDCGNCGE